MQSDDPERHKSNASRISIALILPKRLVKKAKDALKAHGNLDKSIKIRPATLEDHGRCLSEAPTDPRSDAFFIPTKLSTRERQDDSSILRWKEDLLLSFGLAECEKDIGLIPFEQNPDIQRFRGPEEGCEHEPSSNTASKSKAPTMNPLARTVDHWLHELPTEQSKLPFARAAVLRYSWTYMVYSPLLLLPPSALMNLATIFASNDQALPEDLSSLWRIVIEKFKASHIALNAPIPASTSQKVAFQDGLQSKANILRSPRGLVPLYGDFGPALPRSHLPTIEDFATAFWCTARQNNIFQTWAPRYTMFSRGNVSEKARILSLKTLTETEMGSRPEVASAVDLYAGIGYFAFSYAKAGIDKVLCWEINPWSTEGLRRGAKRNGWGVKVVEHDQAFSETTIEKVRLIVFKESNEHAASRIAAMKDSVLPVRHVNCGLLPSSKHSWEIAVQVLDRTGGWIHAHENIAKGDIESRKKEIIETFTQLVEKHWGRTLEVQWEVKCEHVEQVKSYAPGVIHCVLDISILLTE